MVTLEHVRSRHAWSLGFYRLALSQNRLKAKRNAGSTLLLDERWQFDVKWSPLLNHHKASVAESATKAAYP